ncbi:MAG: hypothetical protein ACE5KG_00815 [Nitrososphaerales archaeon]
MVDIVHRPMKEIVVVDYTEYPSPEDLAEDMAMAMKMGQPVALLWTEGVVFVPAMASMDTEKMAEEFLNGRSYWHSVTFSTMPAYAQTLRVRGVEVPVVNVSHNAIMKKVAQWLKGKMSTSSKTTE